MQEMNTRIKIGVQSVEILPMWKAFSVLWRNSSVKLAIGLDTLPIFVTYSVRTFKSRRPKAHQPQAGTMYVQEKVIYHHSEDYSSSDDSFCLQIQLQHMQASSKKIPTPTQLITNLTYRLQPHHTRNQYLQA